VDGKITQMSIKAEEFRLGKEAKKGHGSRSIPVDKQRKELDCIQDRAWDRDDICFSSLYDSILAGARKALLGSANRTTYYVKAGQ
jgi:hypothetical protein